MKNKKFWETNSCEQCGNEFEALKSRKQRFCNGKCSSMYTANDKSRIDKIKKTKLERYGSETYVNAEKAKRTCLEKYGVDNASKTDEVKESIKETVRDRYGVDHFFQSDELKNAVKEKFGVDNVSQLDSVKQKVKDTVNELYGVDNVFQSEDVKKRIADGYMEKYGVSHPSQVDDIKKKKEESRKISFFKKLQTVHKLNLRVEPLFNIDEYVNTDKRHEYKFGCLKCGTEFHDHIDGGHLPRCVKCYPLNKGSICEHEIVAYLKNLLGDDKVSSNRRDIIKGKEIDIYLEDHNIAIEYDSFYYHSFSHVGKNYHLNKTELCEKQGIRLIHIFEDEWITKQDIVKEKLKSIVGLSCQSVYARDCDVREVSVSDKREFLEANHIQGSDNSVVKLGLYWQDKIVAVMTFSENRIALGGKSKTGEYELSRFASSMRVVGGAGKLFKHFTRNYTVNKVTSYADRRFSTEGSSVYDNIGFEYDGVTPENFWYFKNGYNKRYHRFNFRKSVLGKKLKTFDPNLTEYENMQLNGYDKIYDCGNLKYVWSK